MTENLFSIIVPVYKIKEEYLRACVASLLRQTYENFEVILVDDGSPDLCGQICDECAAMDARLTVIHQANAGVSAARNAGLEQAKGELIVFVDADDYLEDAFLERMTAQLPEDAQIISCCAQIIGDDFTTTNHFFSGSRVFTSDSNGPAGETAAKGSALLCCAKKDLFLQLLNRRYGQPQKAYIGIAVPWGKIYRADFLKENSLRFDTGLARMQDNIFNMYAFHAAERIVYIDEPLYAYRLEHIRQSSFVIRGRWHLDTFFAASVATGQCMRSTGLIENPDLKKEYQQGLLHILRSISYRGIFASANGYSWGRKKKEWLELISRPLYQDLQGDFSPVRRRFFFFVLRHRSFLLMAVYMLRCEWKTQWQKLRRSL